jgi:DnaK suppressor protein
LHSFELLAIANRLPPQNVFTFSGCHSMTKKSSRTLEASIDPARRPVNGSDLTEAQLRKMSDSDYMNDAQLAFFRGRLLEMRQEVLAREVGARQRLNESENHADPADRATAEEECFVDMRLREREARLLSKIDESLARIRSRDYGYCTQTGEVIGIARLLARPTASVCVDMKERQERDAQQRG